MHDVLLPSENFEDMELFFNSLGEISQKAFSDAKCIIELAYTDLSERINILGNIETTSKNEEYIKIKLLEYYDREIEILSSFLPNQPPLMTQYKYTENYQEFKKEFYDYSIKELSKILLNCDDKKLKTDCYDQIINIIDNRLNS